MTDPAPALRDVLCAWRWGALDDAEALRLSQIVKAMAAAACLVDRVRPADPAAGPGAVPRQPPDARPDGAEP